MPTPGKRLPPKSASSNEIDQDKWSHELQSVERAESLLIEQVGRLVDFVKGCSRTSFFEFEAKLRPQIFAIGRLIVTLFLCARHEELEVPATETRGRRKLRRRHLQSRTLGTFFGKVRYWRWYMHRRGGGYYPLDHHLQLPADGFSLNLTGLMARLATKVAYAQAAVLMRCFLCWSPSQTTIERSVLGLGKRTEAWFKEARIPEGDGRVLIIMVDSKATPTATKAELIKRRGKRNKRERAASARHRGRSKRASYARKKRRKKGDKSKNGRAATVLVMYTLQPGRDRRGREILKGPINRWIYASYAPKRHVFAIARRAANRRGFRESTKKRIQIVTDGDTDLARYAKEFFPRAMHTLDVFHATEYLWDAGRSLYREGSAALQEWVCAQRDLLYAGKAAKIVSNMKVKLKRLPSKGPGSGGKRDRLKTSIQYLESRLHMMNYGELIDEDLEVGSGSVEGAVRFVVAQRFDCAGMRWIRERSEALVQLRCIEVNGHWEEFIEYVHSTMDGSTKPLARPKLLSKKPGTLPRLGIPA